MASPGKPQAHALDPGQPVPSAAPAWLRTALAYVRVLKPRETLLLWVIGVCTAIVAAQGAPPPGRLALAALAVLLGSGGTNGLTNYLDRHVDARMRRTRRRVLPAGLIRPPEKALAWCLALVLVALALAWALRPSAALAGGLAVLAAVSWRKTWATHFLGSVSSAGPLWVGWLAMRPDVTPTLLLLTAVIALWVPVHVWSLMLTYREDYLRAGVNIFPIPHGEGLTSTLSLVLSFMMLISIIAVWNAGGFGAFYLVAAGASGALMLRAGWGLLRHGGGARAYRVFKLSAYPLLTATFVGMVVDLWLRKLL